MTEEQKRGIKALIDLLDDPDEKIFMSVKTQLTGYGMDAIQQLEDRWENTFDPFIQDRIENVIHRIQFEHIHDQLNQWMHFYADDLLKGYLIVTRYQFPEINEADIIQKIEQIKWDMWLEINENLTALEMIRVVNHVLYDIHKFGANKVNPNAIQNFFLNNLLETQRGNTISLGILYLILCQKLNIPVFGVDLPDHFVLAYIKELRDGEVVYRKDRQDVMFYINPFKKGTIFSRKEIEIYLTQLKLEPEPAFILPCDNIAIIRRLISNLITTYKYFNMEEKVSELEILADLFKRS